MNRAVSLSLVMALTACEAQPGQYQAVAVTTDIAEPGAFEEVTVTRVQPAGGQPRVDEDRKTHCLKEGDAPVRRELTEKFDRLCVGSTLRFERGSIDGEANCFWSSSATERVSMHFSGSYDRERIELVSQASVPGGSVTQTRVLERTGSCLTTREAIDDAIARNDWSIAENKEAIR